MDTSEKSHDKSPKVDVNEETVELPIKPAKEWINMNKIEYDKLEWTKKLPAPKTGDRSTGLPARFDFKVRRSFTHFFLRK